MTAKALDTSDWFELYYIYRGNVTNHSGPLVGIAEARRQAAAALAGCHSLLQVSIVPYAAGNFHPDNAVEKIHWYRDCPCCGQRTPS